MYVVILSNLRESLSRGTTQNLNVTNWCACVPSCVRVCAWLQHDYIIYSIHNIQYTSTWYTTVQCTCNVFGNDYHRVPFLRATNFAKFIEMDLIHYSVAPLILFLVPYTLDLLPYYLSFANGAGGVGIF